MIKEEQRQSGYWRRVFILLVALSGSFCAGCRQVEHNGPVSKDAATRAEVSHSRTVIKADGWKLPVALPEENEKYTATTVTLEGRGLVKVLNRSFIQPEKLLVKFPKFDGSGDVEYKVTQILEMTDKDKKPYCYQFFAEDDTPVYSGTTTYLSYRDDDGDGVFETLAGEGCSVPAWVK